MVMNSLLVESSKISPTKNKSMFFPHGKITGTDLCFVSCWIVGGISIKFYIPTIFKAEIHRFFCFISVADPGIENCTVVRCVSRVHGLAFSQHMGFGVFWRKLVTLGKTYGRGQW